MLFRRDERKSQQVDACLNGWTRKRCFRQRRPSEERRQGHGLSSRARAGSSFALWADQPVHCAHQSRLVSDREVPGVCRLRPNTCLQVWRHLLSKLFTVQRPHLTLPSRDDSGRQYNSPRRCPVKDFLTTLNPATMAPAPETILEDEEEFLNDVAAFHEKRG